MKNNFKFLMPLVCLLALCTVNNVKGQQLLEQNTANLEASKWQLKIVPDTVIEGIKAEVVSYVNSGAYVAYEKGTWYHYISKAKNKCYQSLFQPADDVTKKALIAHLETIGRKHSENEWRLDPDEDSDLPIRVRLEYGIFIYD